MKGIIYYNSSAINANEKLKEVIDQYRKAGIPVIKAIYKITGSYAEFENGNYWKVVRANDSARGYRWNIAYIERSINFDIYQTIIAPTGVNFPFCGIQLWGVGNLHLDDSIPLPF